MLNILLIIFYSFFVLLMHIFLLSVLLNFFDWIILECRDLKNTLYIISYFVTKNEKNNISPFCLFSFINQKFWWIFLLQLLYRLKIIFLIQFLVDFSIKIVLWIKYYFFNHIKRKN